MTTEVLLTGIIIFVIKTIISQIPALWTFSMLAQHTKRTWLLCFTDASLNLLVIAKAIAVINTNPLITLFYAGGFASGTVLGMKLSPHLDRWLKREAQP